MQRNMTHKSFDQQDWSQRGIGHYERYSSPDRRSLQQIHGSPSRRSASSLSHRNQVDVMVVCDPNQRRPVVSSVPVARRLQANLVSNSSPAHSVCSADGPRRRRVLMPTADRSFASVPYGAMSTSKLADNYPPSDSSSPEPVPESRRLLILPEERGRGRPDRRRSRCHLETRRREARRRWQTGPVSHRRTVIRIRQRNGGKQRLLPPEKTAFRSRHQPTVSQHLQQAEECRLRPESQLQSEHRCCNVSLNQFKSFSSILFSFMYIFAFERIHFIFFSGKWSAHFEKKKIAFI